MTDITVGSRVISDCPHWTLSQRKTGVVVAIIRGVFAIVEFHEPGLAGYWDIDSEGRWRRGCFLEDLYLR